MAIACLCIYVSYEGIGGHGVVEEYRSSLTTNGGCRNVHVHVSSVGVEARESIYVQSKCATGQNDRLARRSLQTGAFANILP